MRRSALVDHRVIAPSWAGKRGSAVGLLFCSGKADAERRIRGLASLDHKEPERLYKVWTRNHAIDLGSALYCPRIGVVREGPGSEVVESVFLVFFRKHWTLSTAVHECIHAVQVLFPKKVSRSSSSSSKSSEDVAELTGELVSAVVRLGNKHYRKVAK